MSRRTSKARKAARRQKERSACWEALLGREQVLRYPPRIPLRPLFKYLPAQQFIPMFLHGLINKPIGC